MLTWRSLAYLEQVLDLRAHDRGAADRAAQRRLVDHRPQVRRVGAVQDLLAAHPHRELPLGSLAE